MQSVKSKAELQQQKTKLANSYSELLEEFYSPELRHVGNYTLGRIIGKGSFGKVYLARHNLTNGTKVVLKASSRDDPNLAREIHHHRQFIHPHIARLYEVVITEKQVWLALEFCQGDELYHHLVTNGPQGLPIEKVQKIFAQLVGAVAYIHSKQCVHRDLKLENILLDKNENVKLVDFGFTREYEGKANYLSTFCGTVCYAAPEMLRGEKYAGEKVDVWSLGIVLYALMRGQLPFDEDDDQLTKQRILKEEPVYPESFPEQAKALITRLLSKRPLHRPTLAEVLSDPFLIDHAPAQQAILKLNQPAVFSTPLEKTTLERMKAAGVDIDNVIENVLSQRCDSLAGWWALLIEKESRKEAKRERKRREKEAELKILRRLSGASSRLERIAPTLEDVQEENTKINGTRARSTSRGRTNRRSTPQIMVSDLPRLPEGTAIESPGAVTPPPPIEKDSRRSKSGSRPPIPPKERPRRRSSHLQVVTNHSDLLSGPPNGIKKQRFGRTGGTKSDKRFMNQLTAFKQWFLESTKRAASPMQPKKVNGASQPNSQPTSSNGTSKLENDTAQSHGHSRDLSDTSAQTRNSYGANLTPIASNYSGASNGRPLGPSRLDMQRTRHRTSLSPSPITPRGSYRHSSQGLRGRKSTSSSVSSVRSVPHYNHSKASSISSDSYDASTIHSPGNRSVGRSPHSSVKVLPLTPSNTAFPGGTRERSTSGGHESSNMGSSVMFARRKKSPFKGPMLSSNALGVGGSLASSALGSPAVFGNGAKSREASGSHLNMGLLDARPQRAARAPQRKSLIITEEEEEPEEEIEEEDEIEEVEAFPPVDLGRGESVHSIIFIDDPSDIESEGEADIGEFGHEPYAMPDPDQTVVKDLQQYEDKHVLEHAKEEVGQGIHRIVTKDSETFSPRHTISDGIDNTNNEQDPAKT